MTPQLRPESPLTTAARVATATTCKSGDGSLLRSIPCAEPGSTLGRVGLAHIPSSERAATAARSEEVLLTDGASVACPARPPFFFGRPLRWTRRSHPEKKLVNSLPPL